MDPVRLTPFLAFFLSGASSLIFQSIWTRMLHKVFGSTSIAMSTVLSVFMAGLGLGAWAFGKYAPKIKEPLRAYAIAELGVAVCGIVIPFLVTPDGWLGSVNAWLRASFDAGSWTLAFARFICVVPLLIVPTTLMGSTLPLLARHFVGDDLDPGESSRRVGWLYAVNTFGAVAGTFLAGYVLMPYFGVPTTNATACGMNFALAALIFALRKPLERARAIAPAKAPPKKTSKASDDFADGEREPETEIPPSKLVRRIAVITFGCSGAAALCYEVVWTRALVNVIGGSIYSFTTILMTFLIGIAAGSAFLSAAMGNARRSIMAAGVSSMLLSLVAASPAALAIPLSESGRSTGMYLGMTGAALVAILVLAAVAWQLTRGPKNLRDADMIASVIGVGMLMIPVALALINLRSGPYVGRIVGSVVVCMVAIFAVGLSMKRAPVLLAAVLQLLIAGSTFVNYIWADELSLAFASLVARIGEDQLHHHVGLVQFYMFFVSFICVLPATLGMGAMFPLTIRIWSGGGSKVSTDVGTVYSANTIGSIIGAWLPGFVLMPLPNIGMERTLLWFGIPLNLALALAMVVCAADDSPASAVQRTGEKPSERKIPLWQLIFVYTLAPGLPAIAVLTILVGSDTSFFSSGSSNVAVEASSGAAAGASGSLTQGEPQGPSRPFSLRWRRDRMTLGVFRVSLATDVLDEARWGSADLEFYRDGLSTTVSVESWGDHIALKNNGKVDASNGDDMPTQIMVAGFPLLLHERGPSNLDVAIIGFGSGVTVGTTLQFPVRSARVIELERAIPEASRFFAEVNHLEYPEGMGFPFVRMPRLTVINDDGRNFLASTNVQFDVVMSEPSNPWLTGVSDLFTTDHFRIAKRSLRPGGIFCQWVQLYELSPQNIKTIYRTFASQFRHVVVFAAEDTSSDTIMLGSDSPIPLDFDRIERALELPGVRDELARAHVSSPYDVFARLLLANRTEVEQYSQIEECRSGDGWERDTRSNNAGATPPNCRRVPAPLNTDANAIIEFGAPRDLIAYKQYEGYLGSIYSPEWPYGRLRNAVQFGTGAVAAQRLSEQALALAAHGRAPEAAELIERAQEIDEDSESVLFAGTVIALLESDELEPTMRVEPPQPGAELDREQSDLLTAQFDEVRRATDAQQYATALSALEALPAPLRMHSGPSVLALHAYLIYKYARASNAQHEYRRVVQLLQEVLRASPDYVARHPELLYFLARGHYFDAEFDRAVTNMRSYVITATEAARRAEEARAQLAATPPGTVVAAPPPANAPRVPTATPAPPAPARAAPSTGTPPAPRTPPTPRPPASAR